MSSPIVGLSTLDEVPRGDYVAASAVSRRTVSWPAIFAGLFAAASLQFLFMLLGAGLGFALYTPLTDENPIAHLGTGAAIIQGLSAVVSLWFGGWTAGRFTPAGSRVTGGLHGFLVWSVATIAGIIIVSAGAGWVVGDLSKIVGGGLSLAGKPAAAVTGAAADTAKDALKKSTDTLNSFVEEGVASRPSNSNSSSNSNPTAPIRAKREIGAAIMRAFNPTEKSNPAEARAALVKTLSENGGLSEADANNLVSDWTKSYDQVKADIAAAKDQAEAKARVAADEASDALAVFSFAAFVAFALGAIAAVFGGEHGANAAIRRHHLPEVAV